MKPFTGAAIGVIIGVGITLVGLLIFKPRILPIYTLPIKPLDPARLATFQSSVVKLVTVEITHVSLSRPAIYDAKLAYSDGTINSSGALFSNNISDLILEGVRVINHIDNPQNIPPGDKLLFS